MENIIHIQSIEKKCPKCGSHYKWEGIYIHAKKRKLNCVWSLDTTYSIFDVQRSPELEDEIAAVLIEEIKKELAAMSPEEQRKAQEMWGLPKVDGVFNEIERI